jgi:molecular chaperone GrpE
MTTPDPIAPENDPEAPAGAPETSDGEPDGLSPEERVAELESELAAATERHARAAADYQNLQRRSTEQRAENQRITLTALLLNFLPVYDDLNRALDSIGEHEELTEHQWFDGIRLVQQKFKSVLDGAGVEEIEVDGQVFDPKMHEAIGQAPGPEGRVIHVVQPGYRSADGRVIRAAMVMVGNGESVDGETEPTVSAEDDSSRQ